MVILEKAYKDWLLSKTDIGQDQDEEKMKALNKIMSTLHTIYHQGFLHRCRPQETDETPENTSEKRKIILGRTNLGKL